MINDCDLMIIILLRKLRSHSSYVPVLTDPVYSVNQVDPAEWEVATTEGELTWDVKTLPSPFVKVEFLVIL